MAGENVNMDHLKPSALGRRGSFLVIGWWAFPGSKKSARTIYEKEGKYFYRTTDGIIHRCKLPELCPLCKSPVRLFFINYTDKFLMCENVYCDFPYGHEELKFVKAGEERCDEEGLDFKTKVKSEVDADVSSTGTSGKTSNEVGKKKNNSKFIKYFGISKNNDSRSSKTRKVNEDDQLMQNINDIRELNEELNLLNDELQETDDKEEEVQIKNFKWIKNLKALEEISGMKLLKPEEKVNLKRTEPEIGLGELKFNIISEGNNSTMSEIRIEVHAPASNNTPVSKIKPDEGNGNNILPV